MQGYSTYKKSNGQFVNWHRGPERSLAGLTETPEVGHLPGWHDGAAYYVVPSLEGPIITPRPAMPCTVSGTQIPADGVTQAVISGVPAGAKATVDGQSLTIDDGTLEVVSDYPGTIRVRLSLFPYLDWEVSIDCI